MLNELTEFEIVPEYKIRGTTYWVKVPGSERPLIRIRRDVGATGSIGKVHRVFLDSNPDRWIGLVTDKAAYDFNKTKTGEVGYLGTGRGSLVDPTVFDQEGLGRLTGRATGAIGALLRLPGLGLFVYMHPLNPFFWLATVLMGVSRIHFKFTGDNSPGFEMTKGAFSNKFHVSIHDPRLDRLLIFATTIRTQDDFGYSSPKKVLTEFVSAFDPASWKGPKKLAKSR